MRVERWTLQKLNDAGGPAGVVDRLRHIAPTPTDLTDKVKEIVLKVMSQGDDALSEYIQMYDSGGVEPLPLLVEPKQMDKAIETFPREVVAGLQEAIANVAKVADASLVADDVTVVLKQGQSVKLREIPVDSAAVYVPGGMAPYPSTAVMGVVTARAAGVMNVVVCSPPGADGDIHPTILGTCRLLGVERVYRMGGAHAIAALAFGTPSVDRVDVIVGPGNLWVQEAKREVAGIVGIDGFAGPSDLMVVLGEDANLEAVALDLLAQSEHGPASLVVAVSPSPETLDRLQDMLWSLLRDAPEAELAGCVLIEVADMAQGVELANSFAPEHLQLVGADAELLAAKVRSAGCLLVGEASATAFSDYVAGSNHILPTGGAARFSSGLSPRHFRRRMSEVRIDPKGAGKLARAGAPIARAEGFEWHARSMEARVREDAQS